MLLLAIIAGVFGILICIISFFLGVFGTIYDGSSYLVFASFVCLAFSIIGIYAGVISKKRLKLASVLLLVAALGSIFITFYIVPGIMFIIAGIIGFTRLKKQPMIHG